MEQEGRSVAQPVEQLRAGVGSRERAAGIRIQRGELLKLGGGGKLEGEMDQLLFAPENDAEINAGRDFADLVADPLRDQGCLGIIEDNADFPVEPALVLVD